LELTANWVRKILVHLALLGFVFWSAFGVAGGHDLELSAIQCAFSQE